MKAISCPQCGAVLEKLRIEKDLAQCAYCRATILIRPLTEGVEDFEISLVNRAAGGKEEKETFTRGNLTFSKQKYRPNDPTRLASHARRAGERMRIFGICLLILGTIIVIGLVIFLNSNL